MQNVFTIVLIAAVALFILAGLFATLSRGSAYEQIGKGGLSMDSEGGVHESESPFAQAEREQEIRQLLKARSEREERRGKDPLDIDSELVKLEQQHQPAGTDDPHLIEEIRQLVNARNERRRREGLEPLELEAEVRRLTDQGT